MGITLFSKSLAKINFGEKAFVLLAHGFLFLPSLFHLWAHWIRSRVWGIRLPDIHTKVHSAWLLSSSSEAGTSGEF
jgi:hypothetical protein